MMKITKGDWSLVQLKNLFQFGGVLEFPPMERGKFGYDRYTGKMISHSEELQVVGSLARYNHPKFKDIYYHVKDVVEKVIHEKLYPTYYYDRFYFKGQDLKRHTDRESCEISVSMHISTNADYDWPIYFELENGEVHEMVTKPGDAVLYRGMDLPHWREPLKGDHNTYYHQIFMHFVRRDGYLVHHAFDSSVM